MVHSQHTDAAHRAVVAAVRLHVIALATVPPAAVMSPLLHQVIVLETVRRSTRVVIVLLALRGIQAAIDERKTLHPKVLKVIFVVRPRQRRGRRPARVGWGRACRGRCMFPVGRHTARIGEYQERILHPAREEREKPSHTECQTRALAALRRARPPMRLGRPTFATTLR
jgi:hypothetical protein